MKISIAVAVVLASGIGLLSTAATPPASINYQGVLRSAADAPLTGSYDMVFTFYSLASGGDQILIDTHTAAGTGAVGVTGGLFNTALGAGVLTDGSGPNSYASLSDVFRDYGTVWLEVSVNSESLTPRVRVLAAAYAMNASSLDGRPAGSFLDTSAAAQTKSGPATFDASSAPGISGLTVKGVNDTVGSGSAAYFKDSGHTGQVFLARGDIGLESRGTVIAGIFRNGTVGPYSSEVVLASSSGIGVNGSGFTSGGAFGDGDGTSYAYIAYGDKGIEAHGNAMGGDFISTTGTEGKVATSDSGGDFTNPSSGAEGKVATSSYGIDGRGPTAGGYFQDTDSGGYAYVGYGTWGISAYGSSYGGNFGCPNAGVSLAEGPFGRGVDATGVGMGGSFYDMNDSGSALVGYGDWGINAYGTSGGGWFYDSNNQGQAFLGIGDTGIEAYGWGKGGFFKDNASPNNYAYVAAGDFKILGTGTVAFIQNHPTDTAKVIVYACPEGDESATYTRGTARLIKGEARVRLGETFQWVTNPDIGLTAQVTPRGSPVPLSVESVSTRELVVKGPTDDDAAFDYVVYGLRIGFEDRSIVQERQRDAPTPSSAERTARYQLYPELRKYNALERFRAMRVENGDLAPVDLAASKSLYEAINAETNHAAPSTGAVTPLSPSSLETEPPPRSQPERASTPTPAGLSSPPHESAAVTTSRVIEAASPGSINLVRVSAPVEAGDVLVVDRESPGTMRLGSIAGDPTLVGIVVAADPTNHIGPGEAPLAFAGTVVPCKVDATSGAIHVGDLLAVSATPGHAMRSIDPIPGTILGKALEELETGTGVIRILVMFR